MSSYDEAVLALITGTAVTSEQVDEVRRHRDAVTALAEEVGAGARTRLPEAPVSWCSEAGTAYAEVLVGVAEALTSISATLTTAELGLSSCLEVLQARLDEQEAALASRPVS
ncbi:hypothetical protein [Agromyces allii]|uniref:Uncharacterized protein n=1 Tax=Agromyces allii TaxID=393607 RepID=A0ABN2QTD5_9MICO|nr:hypothetical protein [Agromyces allii]